MVTFWRGATLPRGRKPNKYGARRAPCEQGGEAHWHDSQKERERCFVLHQRQALGEIRGLRRQPRWDLRVAGQRVGWMTLDFAYWEDHRFVAEDVKGGRATRTEAYQLRKRLLKAVHGIEITEV